MGCRGALRRKQIELIGLIREEGTVILDENTPVLRFCNNRDEICQGFASPEPCSPVHRHELRKKARLVSAEVQNRFFGAPKPPLESSDEEGLGCDDDGECGGLPEKRWMNVNLHGKLYSGNEGEKGSADAG